MLSRDRQVRVQQVGPPTSYFLQRAGPPALAYLKHAAAMMVMVMVMVMGICRCTGLPQLFLLHAAARRLRMRRTGPPLLIHAAAHGRMGPQCGNSREVKGGGAM